MTFTLNPAWKPGDPCPHCRKGPVKFNGGNPVCLACGGYVDGPPPAGDHGDQDGPGGDGA